MPCSRFCTKKNSLYWCACSSATIGNRKRTSRSRWRCTAAGGWLCADARYRQSEGHRISVCRFVAQQTVQISRCSAGHVRRARRRRHNGQVDALMSRRPAASRPTRAERRLRGGHRRCPPWFRPRSGEAAFGRILLFPAAPRTPVMSMRSGGRRPSGAFCCFPEPWPLAARPGPPLAVRGAPWAGLVARGAPRAWLLAARPGPRARGASPTPAHAVRSAAPALTARAGSAAVPPRRSPAPAAHRPSPRPGAAGGSAPVR